LPPCTTPTLPQLEVEITSTDIWPILIPQQVLPLSKRGRVSYGGGDNVGNGGDVGGGAFQEKQKASVKEVTKDDSDDSDDSGSMDEDSSDEDEEEVKEKEVKPAKRPVAAIPKEAQVTTPSSLVTAMLVTVGTLFESKPPLHRPLRVLDPRKFVLGLRYTDSVMIVDKWESFLDYWNDPNKNINNIPSLSNMLHNSINIHSTINLRPDGRVQAYCALKLTGLTTQEPGTSLIVQDSEIGPSHKSRHNIVFKQRTNQKETPGVSSG
nr:hypothetical protein [Tanacetum cinerariifolium]